MFLLAGEHYSVSNCYKPKKIGKCSLITIVIITSIRSYVLDAENLSIRVHEVPEIQVGQEVRGTIDIEVIVV